MAGFGGGGGTLGPDSPSLSWHLPHQGALACPGAAEFEECLGSRGREEIWAGGDQNQQVVWVSGAHQDPGPSQSSEPCPLYLFIRLDGAGRLGYGKGLLMEGTVRKKAPLLLPIPQTLQRHKLGGRPELDGGSQMPEPCCASPPPRCAGLEPAWERAGALQGRRNRKRAIPGPSLDPRAVTCSLDP